MKNLAAMFVIFCSTVFHECLCWPSGAPASQCDSMLPSHGVAAQTGQSPYKINVEKPYYKLGENVKLSIESSSENVTGFLIQARKVGENSALSSGMFATPPDNTKYVTCNTNTKGAISHNKRLSVKTINFEWEPPTNLSGNISFFATVVKEKVTFWVQLESPELYMKNVSMESSTTIAPTKSTMYSTPVMSSTVNSTCKYADKTKCDGIQLHHNIVFLFFMGIFLAFWQN